MEYWVRAKLPSSPPGRTENEVPRQLCQLRRTLVRSYEDTGPVVIVRRVEGSKSRQPSPFCRSLRLIVASCRQWVQTENACLNSGICCHDDDLSACTRIRIPRLSGRWRRRRRGTSVTRLTASIFRPLSLFFRHPLFAQGNDVPCFYDVLVSF